LQGGGVTEVPNPVGTPPAPATAPAGQVVTHIFKLNFESANNLVTVLRPLISPNNTINVNPGNNSLIITDYADNLQRLGRIIAALDVANASDIEVIVLKHALASELAPLVTRLLEPGAGGGAPGQGNIADNSFKTTVMAEPRANSLILRAANPARVAQVRSLIDKLDQPSSALASGNIHVVYLKNAEATKLAVTLRAALTGQTGLSTPGANTANTATMAQQPTPPGGNAAAMGSSITVDNGKGRELEGDFGAVSGKAGFNGDNVSASMKVGHELGTDDTKLELEFEAGFVAQGVTRADRDAFVSTSDVGFYDTPPELQRGKNWSTLPADVKRAYVAQGWSEQEWADAASLKKDFLARR
jgi:general secretion pathway protein D